MRIIQSIQLKTGKLLTFAIAASVATTGLTHDSPNDGHIPKDVNYGFEVVGRDTLGGVTDGQYTDVWSHKGFAYVGTFQEPCSNAGVFIVDIDAAIANYPDTEGATVASGFAQSEFIPVIVQQMISTGEQTGSLPKVMARVADYYERELTKRANLLAKSAEPVMLLVMGVVVGLLVSSLILPIFKLSRAVY